MVRVAVVAACALFACSAQAGDEKYMPTQPMDFRGAKVDFLPEQMIWVKPLIRLMGCIYAQRAVRHHLKPEPVGFEPCGDGGKVNTTLDDNLIDLTVSGIATIGESERPFTVILQHYPPSTDEDGYITIGIDVK